MSSRYQTDVSSNVLTIPSAAADSAALTMLVVEPKLDELLATVSMLSLAGFRVTAVESFTKAKPLLGARSPAILLTSLRLGSYNGLHLVVRGRSLQPSMAAIVTSAAPDTGAQHEAENLGATFVVKPIPPNQLIASILKTYYRAPNDTTPIRPPYDRRQHQRRAALAPVDADRRQSDRRRLLPWLLPSS